MKHITEQWNQSIYESAQWKFYFGGLRVGVLDIETTGLNPARNKFVLGCLYDLGEEHKSGTLHQVLAQSRAEEQAALNEYMKLVDEMDVVVTYNGRHFDIPFLEKRCSIAHKQTHWGDRMNCYDLDLFQVLNNHSPIKKLVPNMKQKTIENYMGFWDSRADEISGAESVELFNHYEATGDPEAEKKILLHNNDDVRQLTRLTKAIIKSDFHKAMFRQGFPVKTGERLLAVKQIKADRSSLEIKGIQHKSPINYMGFEIDGWPVTSRFESMRRSDAESEGTSGVQSAGTGDTKLGKIAGTFEMKIPIIRQNNLAVVDLRAAGLETEKEASAFASYPMCGSGFLVIEEDGEMKYRETNHFVREFIKKFIREEM